MFKGKYSNSISHDIMVSDSYRMETYYKAIKNKVSKGDVVVDFGAGSGVQVTYDLLFQADCS